MYKLTTLETGFFLADGGAMFGAIPKRAWSRKYPSDENNLCRLAMRCVLAESENKKVLIDTGIRYESVKDFSYYGFTQVRQIDDALENIGVSVSDITDVVLTHFHFDHCGAATVQDEKGEWYPRFLNARYWCSRRQWQEANNPGILELGSYVKEDFIPLYHSGQITLLDEACSLDNFFRFKIFDGHTPGQLACYIDGKEQNYIVPGDVVPTSCNIPLRWVSAYDVHAQASVEAKMELLDDAVAENRKLIFFHDAYTVSAEVIRAGDTFMAKK